MDIDPQCFIKRLCFVTAAALIFNGCSRLPVIQDIERVPVQKEEAAALPAKEVYAVKPAPQLPAYEKLTYEVRWLGMRVGVMTTSVEGIKEYKGRRVYILEATMKTTPGLSKVFKIDDKFISYMDVETLATLRHEVHRRDGWYKKDAVTEFDQVNHKAYFRNLEDASEKVFDIPENVQDILTGCYYLMLLPVQLGTGTEYFVSNNEQNYHFFAFVESRVTIKLKTFDKQKKSAFLIAPYAKLDGKRVEEGHVTAYFSCDERRIPLFAILKGPKFVKVTISLSNIETDKK